MALTQCQEVTCEGEDMTARVAPSTVAGAYALACNQEEGVVQEQGHAVVPLKTHTQWSISTRKSSCLKVYLP